MDDVNESNGVHTEKMDTDINKTTTKFNIEKTCLKHILIAMTISGGYNGNKGKICSNFTTIYRIFIFLALLAFIAKTAWSYAFISKSDFFGHTIVLAWNISNTIMFLLSLRMNHTTFGNQEHTFKFLNTTVLPQMANLGIKFEHEAFKRKQIGLCIVAVVIVTILVLFSVLQLSGIIESGNSAMMTLPFENTPLTSFVQVILLVFCSLQAIIPTLYMIVICYMITIWFHGFNQYLHTEMCNDACHLPHTMQTIRQYYTNLCKAVGEFDKDFRYLLGNLVFWHITLSLFTLYVILRVDIDQNGIIVLVTYIFWLLFSVAVIVSISVFAALVHEAVRHFSKNI